MFYYFQISVSRSFYIISINSATNLIKSLDMLPSIKAVFPKASFKFKSALLTINIFTISVCPHLAAKCA